MPSLVVKDREILMSGRYQSASANFNKAYYDSFEEQEIKLYATDDAKYHIEVPLAKKTNYRIQPTGYGRIYEIL